MKERLEQIYRQLSDLEQFLNQDLTPEKRREYEEMKRELMAELLEIKKSEGN